MSQSQVAGAGAAVAAAAGVVAGVVGLGGGTMVAPILLEFRIHPQVTGQGGEEGGAGGWWEVAWGC